MFRKINLSGRFLVRMQSSSTPRTVGSTQSPNSSSPWSTSQRQRQDAYSEARFEQTDLTLQPQPLSAMEMIAKEPIRLVEGRRAVCDGGKSPREMYESQI